MHNFYAGRYAALLTNSGYSRTFLVLGTVKLAESITGWKLVDPTPGEIPRLFLVQKIRESHKWSLKFQGRDILWEKRPLPGMPRVLSELFFYQKTRIPTNTSSVEIHKSPKTLFFQKA